MANFDHFDVLHDHRILRMVLGECDRTQTQRHRIPPDEVTAVLAHRHARALGRIHPPGLHVPTAGDRHSQARGIQLPALPRPYAGLVFRRPEHVDRVRHPSPPRLPMRRWGRFFLRLHAINGLLLP